MDGWMEGRGEVGDLYKCINWILGGNGRSCICHFLGRLLTESLFTCTYLYK